MRSILLLLVLGLVAGCTGHKRDLGGVVVGNGMQSDELKSYYASALGIGFRYNTQLDLKVDAKHVFLENRTLVNYKQPVSRLTFERVETGAAFIKNRAQLVNFATEQEGREFLPIPFVVQGAIGVFSEDLIRSPEGQAGNKVTFYFLSADYWVFRASLTEWTGTVGYQKLRPVLATFYYDVTPPTIHRISYGVKVVPAGKSFPVEIDVEDDISGVIGGSLKIIGYRSKVVTPSDLLVYDLTIEAKHYDPVAKKLKFEFPIPTTARAGFYSLGNFFLKDLARNETSVIPNLGLFYVANTLQPKASVLEALEFTQPALIPKGKDGKATVALTFSNPSPIVEGGELVFLLQHTTEPNTKHYFTGTVRRDGERYFADVVLMQHMDPGTYRFDVVWFRRSTELQTDDLNHLLTGIVTSVEKFSSKEIFIENENSPDFVAPRLESVQIEYLDFFVALNLRVRDDESGMLGGNFAAYFEHELSDKDKPSRFKSHQDFLVKNQNGPNQYRFLIPIPKFTKAGKYILTLRMTDRIGNYFYLELANKEDSAYRPYIYLHAGAEKKFFVTTDIPLLSVEIRAN